MTSRNSRPYALFCAFVACLTGLLVVYSQTAAFAWDEGFHLLCAQNIVRGKLPYVDFAFSQTPLNAFWNAFWMRIFGDTWRTAHAVAALCTGGAILLAADYTWRRISKLAAFGVAVLIGLNVLVMEFGAIGQAYAFCLLLIVAAFRAAIAADEGSAWFAGLSGLLAGAAANSSLLTAPVTLVLLVWLTVRRRRNALPFIAGAFVACLPLAYLFLRAPESTWFGIFQYNFLYRGVQWASASEHNREVFVSWMDAPQALLLLALVFWKRARRADLTLCGWLALALTVHISTAHPTFSRYYLFVVPFLAIAATPMLQTRKQVGAVTLLMVLSLGKTLYDDRDDMKWSDMEAIARKVDEVTPAGAPLAADDLVYFLTKRPAPSGMELTDSHKLEFDAARSARLHLIAGAELQRRVNAGLYSTVLTCKDPVNENVYRHKIDYEEEDCTLYWDPIK